MITNTPPHCGLVAVLGAPNAGKSTLVNALVGQKVAIVSAKAQTTRARLMGIALEGPTPAPTPPITPTPPTPGTAEAIPLPPELLAVLVFVLAMTGIWFILRKKSTT